MEVTRQNPTNTMIQLILHLAGDYVFQSDWMAQNKTKSSWAALCHATVYSLPFAAIASLNAWLVIWATHLLIDRFRLARYVVWLKNFLAPVKLQPVATAYPSLDAYEAAAKEYLAWKELHSWENCAVTGYHKDSPVWLSVRLMIAADNTLHLAINAAAIAWL